MDNNVITKIKWAIIIMTAVLLVTNGERWYWSYYPFKPAILHSIKITNPEKTVCRGQLMTYDVDIDKKMDVPVTIKRQLVNSRVVTINPENPPWKPLGRKIYHNAIMVSPFDDLGEWWMRWTAEYEVGPNGRIVPVHGESDKYIVVDCSSKKK